MSLFGISLYADFSLISVLYFVCIIGLLVLTFFIWSKDTRAPLNRTFALFGLSIVGWLGTLYEFNRQADTPFLTTLGRLNFALPIFIMFFGFLFVREITDPSHKKQPRWIAPVLMLETVLLAALTLFTPWVDALEHIVDGQHTTVFGKLFPLYLAHMGLYITGALAVAFLSSRNASKRIRSQLAIIGIGIIVTTAIAVVTNLLLPYLFGYFALQEVGALSTLFFLSALAYAISMHQLFDVRVIIKRTFVYTLLLTILVASYSVIIFVFTRLIQGGVSYDPTSFVTNIVAAIVIGVSLNPLRLWLEARTDGFLFKSEYQHQQIVKEVTQKLLGVVALDEALKTLMESMVKVLHLHHAVTYVFQPGEGGLPVVKRIQQIGYDRLGPDNLSRNLNEGDSSTRLLLGENDPLVAYFLHQPAILSVRSFEARLTKEGRALDNPNNRKAVTSEVNDPGLSQRVRDYAIARSVLKKLHSLNVALAIPLELNGQLLGLVLLSEKKSDESYSESDLELLEAMSAQGISAIQKAKLFEGDQLKSEFVSIASHELLTPISAMEGYLSMILDENMGTIDPQARGYLEKVYSSAHRLATLVKDLLSVSRIDSGKIKIEQQQLDIGKLIAESVDQLRFKAQEKGLELVYETADNETAKEARGKAPSRKTLPQVWADPDRTTEILVNLIGNAIKYTPSGRVTINAEAESEDKPASLSTQCVRISVQDTGLGMSREAQSHLFEKFYRVATPETSGIQGTGLGLYITRSMVEKMGGSIALQSTPGQGSTFSFTLPVFQIDNISNADIGPK